MLYNVFYMVAYPPHKSEITETEEDFFQDSAAPSRAIIPSSKNIFTYYLQKTDWNLLSEKKDDPQEIFSITHDYFSECCDALLTPTFTGLGLRLGYSKQELINLKREDSPQGKAIRMAAAVLVDMVERELITTKAGQIGLIFWLKNIDDWVDKTEVETSKKETMKDFLEKMKKASVVQNHPQTLHGVIESPKYPVSAPNLPLTPPVSESPF